MLISNRIQTILMARFWMILTMVYSTQNYWVPGLCPSVHCLVDKVQKPSNSDFLWVFLIMKRPNFFLPSVFSLHYEHPSSQWYYHNTFCSSSNIIPAIESNMESSVFWIITLCSSLKVNGRFGGTCHLHLHSRRISHARNQHEAGSRQSSCLAYSSTLKMEATCSSETSVDFKLTTWRCKPEDITLHNRRCENLKSYKMKYGMVGIGTREKV
jgi:hypothetical protein